MRLKALLLVTALSATALPASAQSYSQNCREARGGNQAAGLVLGGILGGVLGSNVAASGHRHDGTAVGAVLGGLVGSEIGRNSTDCNPTYHGPVQGYGPAPYTPSPYAYGGYPSTYRPAPGYAPPAGQGYYPEPEYGYGSAYDRDFRSRGEGSDRLYHYESRDYRSNDDYAGRDCTEVTQITRLPDGAEIRRPVEACRNAYYGDWHVED
jgi:hypothetical protein